MALKFGTLFGSEKGKPVEAALDMPTTQIKMNQQPGYDPLASVSIMDQLRSAQASMTTAPRKLWLIGNLPVVKQFQTLGVLLVTFLVFSALMVFLDNRQSSQAAAAAATATEMQMLSQRLARGSALASQGQPAAFAAVKDSRERFKTDLEALLVGGTVRGVTVETPSDEATVKTVGDVKQRWERVDNAAGRLLDNETSLTSLAKGLETLNIGNNAILELAQQASAQIGQSGGSLREIEYTNQLAVLSQRIAKNANTLASSDEIDPEVAFLLGKDAGTFRDILSGLLKGSESLRLAPVKSDEARATLADLQKRFTAYETGVNAILTNMPRLADTRPPPSPVSPARTTTLRRDLPMTDPVLLTPREAATALGIGRSKLTLPMLEKATGRSGTARNWNTVLALQRLARERA